MTPFTAHRSNSSDNVSKKLEKIRAYTRRNPFSLELPAHLYENADRDSLGSCSTRPAAFNMTEHPQPVRIFLAEDHLPDVILIKEALRHAKITYDLEHVEDGEQAIRALLERDTANRPQLIIVDINLPKKTGFEVIQALRD